MLQLVMPVLLVLSLLLMLSVLLVSPKLLISASASDSYASAAGDIPATNADSITS